MASSDETIGMMLLVAAQLAIEAGHSRRWFEQAAGKAYDQEAEKHGQQSEESS